MDRKTISELRDEHSHLIRSAKDMADKADKEGRTLTKEEQGHVDDYLKNAGKIKDEIKAIEEDDARRARIDAEIKNLGQSKGRQTQPQQPASENPQDNEPTLARVTAGSYTRYGKLQAFKGDNAEFDALTAGHMIRAGLGNRASLNWCDRNGVDVRNAMSTNPNTAGGFLVAPAMSQAIIDLREQYGVFRQNARITPMSSDTLMIPRVTGHLTANFVGEKQAITESDMTFDQVQLVAKKLGVLTYMSSEVNEDAIISVTDLLARDIAYALALKEDQCGFTGAGTSVYGGINGITNKIIGTAGAVTAANDHDTFAELDAADIANLIAKLPEYASMNAKFFCSRVAKALVFDRLKATAGGNTVQTLGGAPQDSYLGYPIITSQVLPTSTGDLSSLPMILFGDLSLSSTIGDRRSLTLAQDTSVKFVEDQIAIKATSRVDISNHNVGTASAAGAVVALIGH